MTYTYLASPYSHPDHAIKMARFKQVCIAAGKLMLKGEIVFSPIAHTHWIEYYGTGTGKGHEFWMRQDEPFAKGASKIVVLKIPGWDISKGVKEEIEWAKENNIPVEFMEEQELYASNGS